jgi:hypothetical protein
MPVAIFWLTLLNLEGRAQANEVRSRCSHGEMRTNSDGKKSKDRKLVQEIKLDRTTVWVAIKNVAVYLRV